MWKDFVVKKITTLSEEIRYVRPDGKLTYALIEANYIAGGNFKTIFLLPNELIKIFAEENGCLVVATDITEIKDLEQQRYVNFFLYFQRKKVLIHYRVAAITKAEEEQRRRAQDAEYHKQLQEQFVNTICHEIRYVFITIYL